MSKKIPKTNWYKGKQKPVREGPYQRLYPNTVRGHRFYCWFDKKAQKFGPSGKTPDEAKALIKHGYSDFQELPWCGLSRNPDEVAK